jgi:hypothetical protein
MIVKKTMFRFTLPPIIMMASPFIMMLSAVIMMLFTAPNTNPNRPIRIG